MATHRNRSRSPIKQEHGGRASPTPSDASNSTNNSGKFVPMKKMYPTFDMRIFNVPKHWSWKLISSHIKKHTDPIDENIGLDIQHINIKYQSNQNVAKKECIVKFSKNSSRRRAFEILVKSKEIVEGLKLYYTLLDYVHSSSKKPFTNPHYQQNMSIFKPGGINMLNRNLLSSDAEEGNTFGLSAEYLHSLGIQLPLTRKIFVTYLNCLYDNEHKVRNLFSLAGNVVSVQLLFKDEFNSARVEFDHPVEAVQAVSMFNGKELFGMVLKIKIDSIRMVLPEGLTEHGAGLGPNGQPMRGIRVAVEVRSLKTDIINEVQKLHETIDELKQRVINLEQVQQQPVNQNPLAVLGNLIQPMQILQGLVPQNQRNDFGVMLQNLAQNLNNNNWLNPQVPILDNQIPLAGAANMQGPLNNMQGGPMQGPPNNMQGGPMQGPLNNMQGGPMQGPPNNMQGGPMQGPPNNMQGGPMQGPPNNMQGGPMQGPPNNMQRGPSNNMQGPGNNMQGPGGNIQRPGMNMQGLGMNKQSPCVNMQGPGNFMPGPGNNMQGPGNNMQGLGNNMHGPGNNINGPGNNMNAPGNNMHGPGNNMHGPGNNLHGPGNNMHGPGNNMHGPGNNMQGPGNNMNGPGNNVHVPGNNMNGPGNNVHGPGNNMPGPGNNMHGPGNNINGPGNNMNAPGNNMNGPGNNMNGPGNNMQGPGNMQRGPGNFMQGGSNMQPNVASPHQVNQNSFGPGQNNDGFNMPSCSNQQGYSNMPGNSNRQNEGSGSSILLFKNLPPSVHLATLQAKMNEVGNVRLVEMTGQGRAIVNFHSEFDADKCLRLFHQSKVDGQIIEVRKI